MLLDLADFALSFLQEQPEDNLMVPGHFSGMVKWLKYHGR